MDLDIPRGGGGRETLRLGVGRDHGQSLQPYISRNGHTLHVPSDWMGYDQRPRGRFFGVLDILYPMFIYGRTIRSPFVSVMGEGTSVV